MATKQTLFFTGNARPVFGNAFRSGSPIIFRHTHVFREPVLATDELELFTIPAYAQIARFRCSTANVGAINLNIGLMTGTPGDLSAARALVSAGLISGVAANAAVIESTLDQLNAIGRIGDSPVSVGLDPATDITAAVNKSITFEVSLF